MEPKNAEPVVEVEAKTDAAPEETPPSEAWSGDAFIKELLDESFDGEDELMPEVGQEHKGLPSARELLATAPEDVRKLVGNMRAAMTRAQQEAAELRRAKEAEGVRTAAHREMLAGPDMAERLKALVDQGEEPDFDTLTGEGLRAYTDYVAAKRAKEAVKEAMEALVAPMQKQMEDERRKAKMDIFVAQHPDIKDEAVQTQVVEALRANPNLRTEEAYYIVRGRMAANETKAASDRRLDIKSRRREREFTLASGTQGKPDGYEDPMEVFQRLKRESGLDKVFKEGDSGGDDGQFSLDG